MSGYKLDNIQKKFGEKIKKVTAIVNKGLNTSYADQTIAQIKETCGQKGWKKGDKR